MLMGLGAIRGLPSLASGVVLRLSASDTHQMREPGKRRCSKRRVAPWLPQSSPCPVACRARDSGLEKLPVNRVQDEGQNDRTPLLDCVMVSRLRFGTISRPTENGFANARAVGSSDQSAGARAPTGHLISRSSRSILRRLYARPIQKRTSSFWIGPM